jgi:hypothetical protein
LSREELIALIYELMGKIHDLEEELHLKQMQTTSKNSSQPPSRDFKPEKKRRKRSRKKGAKPGHEKHERGLVDKPSKVIDIYVDNCSNCQTNLLERYREYRNSLFIFLHRSDVPADNNACERALRPSVIHRKVMGSFRSNWGAQACATLATVLNTAKRNGQSSFHKLVQLMGKPVLPFLYQPAFP